MGTWLERGGGGLGRLQWVQNYPGKVWTGRERGQHQKGKVKVGARWALEAAGLGSPGLRSSQIRRLWRPSSF